MQYIDGFASKLHISYFPETDCIAPLDIDITVLHYVSKLIPIEELEICSKRILSKSNTIN